MIAAPSSSTSRAIVASSKTIDLTGLPPVRRRTSGVLSIDRMASVPAAGKEGVGAADARDPDQPVRAGEHRPRRPGGSAAPARPESSGPAAGRRGL